MSIRAMSWALKDAPVPDPVAHLILIGLADHAADDGTNARPSRATLADYAHVTSRTVGTKLKLLEETGVIRRGDQQQVAHLRSDRRPVVWDLNLALVRGDGGKDFPVVDNETDYGMNTASPRAEDMEGYDGNGASPRAVHGGNEASPRTPHDGNTASPRTPDSESTGGKLFPTEPSLSTTNLVSSSTYLSNASEATANITGNGESDPDRDVVLSNDLRPHTPPGAWSPSPAAWDEARAVCTTINLQLHLARYRVVKKEKKEQPSNGEWLRWAIQDETKAQEELKRQRAASRQTKTWWGVAD